MINVVDIPGISYNWVRTGTGDEYMVNCDIDRVHSITASLTICDGQSRNVLKTFCTMFAEAGEDVVGVPKRLFTSPEMKELGARFDGVEWTDTSQGDIVVKFCRGLRSAGDAYLRTLHQNSACPMNPRFAFVSHAKECQIAAGLPERKTKKSAGYDFTAPADIVIPPSGPGFTTKVETGIKAYMPDDVVLLLFPCSSMGADRGIVLANGVSVIDADYVDNEDNEGNITATLYNHSKFPQVIRAGERYMQGVFVKFMTV